VAYLKNIPALLHSIITLVALAKTKKAALQLLDDPLMARKFEAV
jgi:hypothetical protein